MVEPTSIIFTNFGGTNYYSYLILVDSDFLRFGQMDWSTHFHHLIADIKIHENTTDHSVLSNGPMYIFRECESHWLLVFKERLAAKSDILLGWQQRVRHKASRPSSYLHHHYHQTKLSPLMDPTWALLQRCLVDFWIPFLQTSLFLFYYT